MSQRIEEAIEFAESYLVSSSSILNGAQAVIYENEESPDYPYSGPYATCFPVRFKQHLFILTALHCSQINKYNPLRTLYQPNRNDRTILSFDGTLSGRNHNINSDRNEDFIFLKVSRQVHTFEYLDSIKAIDISQSKYRASLNRGENIVDLYTRGFPSEISGGIDYESCRISTRAYMTNGYENVSESSWPGCYYVKFINPKPSDKTNIPNGMSGAPVYAIKLDGNIGLAGMIIEYSNYDEIYLILGVEVLYKALQIEYET